MKFFSCIWIWLQLWNSDHGHVIEACKASLKKLQLDYLDLFLIHFPIATKHTGLSSMPCSSFIYLRLCIVSSAFFFFFWGMTHNGTMYMQWHKFMGLRCNDKMTCLVLQESFSVFWFCRTLCKSDSWFLGIFYVILHTCRCGHNWECSGRGWGVGHRHNHIPGNYLACYGRIGFYGFSSKHWDKVCS